MSLDEVIQGFVDFVGHGDRVSEDPQVRTKSLLLHLDRLALSMHSLENLAFDNSEYPVPPELDYQTHLERFYSHFPDFQFYLSVDPLEILEIDTAKIYAQDPWDDLADIHADLRDYLWRLENTSKADALWHLNSDYCIHWAEHLRNLQGYLQAFLSPYRPE